MNYRKSYLKNHDVDIVIKNGIGKEKLRFKNCKDITIDNEENMIVESFDGGKIIQSITTITIMKERFEK